MSLLSRTKFIVLVAGIAVLAALPTQANAAIMFGLESNAEFTNSDRTPDQQASALLTAKGLGAQVVRANVNWADVAINCGGQSTIQLADNANGCYRWNVLDSLVSQARNSGTQLLFSVSRSPVWVNNNPDNMYVGASGAEFDNFVAHYTAFITAIGTRYNATSPIGTVKMWTIWNEPNSAQFWQPLATKAQMASAPLRYAALYAKAAVALRSANGAAMIAPGPTGPSPAQGVRAGTFIAAFQKQAIKFLPGSMTAKRSYINAWAHNPYPYGLSPRSTSPSSRLKYPNLPIQRTKDLVKLLDSSPLTKGRTIWATEFGYETYPGDKQVGISQLLQGRYMAEAFDVLDATGRVSIGIWYGMTDPIAAPDWQSGTFLANGKMKPSALWARRPISVNMTKVKRGGKVQIWAKSAVKPKSTVVQMSINGKSWKTVTGIKRRADGSIRANLKISAKKTWFRTFDGVAGPSVMVVGS